MTRVRDRNFGFGRDLVGSHRLFDAVREHLRGDLADGGVDRLARRAAEIFQFEEIPGIGRFDGAQGRGFRCVGDRGETEFDLASVGRSADEGVDREHAEFGNDGFPRTGCGRCGHACDQYGGFNVFHRQSVLCIYRKDNENTGICETGQKKS